MDSTTETAVAAVAGRVLGNDGFKLSLERMQLLAGTARRTAPEWCADFKEYLKRLYPLHRLVFDCYRCMGDGYYSNRLCEVCGGFGRSPSAPVYRCPTCRDEGSVRGPPLRLNHPQFGLSIECPNCTGTRVAFEHQIDLAVALQQAHVPKEYRKYTLASFANRPDLTETMLDGVLLAGAWSSITAQFTAQYAGRAGVVFESDVGVGKTGLSVAALAEAARFVPYPRYASWLGLLSLLRHNWNRPGGMTQTEIMQAYGRAPVLLLDDFGTTGTEGGADKFALALAEELWELRSTHGNLWTLVTTNLSQEQLSAEFGPRVVSRILKHCVWLRMEGPDARIADVD